MECGCDEHLCCTGSTAGVRFCGGGRGPLRRYSHFTQTSPDSLRSSYSLQTRCRSTQLRTIPAVAQRSLLPERMVDHEVMRVERLANGALPNTLGSWHADTPAGEGGWWRLRRCTVCHCQYKASPMHEVGVGPVTSRCAHLPNCFHHHAGQSQRDRMAL